LSLTGELDFASTPLLEDRLVRLRATRSPIQLNLSKLAFIDSTGIRLLIQTVGYARIKRWEFHIDRDVAPAVMRVFQQARVDRYLATSGTLADR
jgi:anti-anti-sigma factor